MSLEKNLETTNLAASLVSTLKMLVQKKSLTCSLEVKSLANLRRKGGISNNTTSIIEGQHPQVPLPRGRQRGGARHAAP